jgi:dTDP-glucose 4,6-dehydratase
MIDLNGKTVLVTGGRGFIGSNFVEYIIDNYNNVSIINVDKLGIGSREIYPDEDSYNYEFLDINDCKYQFINVDLINKGELDYITNKYKFDYIFHFAAESHVDRSINNPTHFITNNAIGTANLMQSILENQKHNPRIINISTDEVYGHLNLSDEPFTEESILNPRSPYAASKAASDLISLSYHHTFGLDVMVTRCCNNYGENQYDEKFIPTILRKLVNKEKIPVYGEGSNIREWIYVKDHNKYVLEVADRGVSGGIYNIGTGVELTNLQLIQKVIDKFDDCGTLKLSDAIEFVQDRKGHDFRYAIESKSFQFSTPLEDFDDALTRTVNFYKRKYGNLQSTDEL